MNCPKCDHELAVKLLGTIQVDECPACGGTWFDRDELRQAKDQADPDLNWMDFELWKHQDRFKIKAQQVACPKCTVDMVVIDYGDTRIEIDHCPLCEGVWLDAGEFEKIIAALTQELLTKTLPEYIKASLEEAAEIIKGPERLLSEWRDFLTVFRMLQYRVLTNNLVVSEALTKVQSGSPFR
ncbi:MAG: zf-TFIIB domain-containing protein [Fidelibacterota bacterium]|nr:MAG: zf-TFIIB domain-containing protein [Candidatus Neomarinimicrobiota bacterium]